MGGQPSEDNNELEPSTLWKSRLKARIEQNLDFLIQDAREALHEALSSARSDAERSRLRAQFTKDTAHLGLLAHEQYEMELKKEREERKKLWGGGGKGRGVDGLGGVVVEEDEDEEDEVVREQREILEAIRRSQISGHQRGTSSSSSASYSSSPGAGPSYTSGRYAREDTTGGAGHQRRFSSSSSSSASAAAAANQPVAGPSYTSGRYSRESTPAPRGWTPAVPDGHQRTTSSSSAAAYSRPTAPVPGPSYTSGRYSREPTPAPRTWTPAIPEGGRQRNTSTSSTSTSPTASYRPYTPAIYSTSRYGRESTSTPAPRTWTPAPRPPGTPIYVPVSTFKENYSPSSSPPPPTSTSWSAPSRVPPSTSPPASGPSSSWTPPSRLNTPGLSGFPSTSSSLPKSTTPLPHLPISSSSSNSFSRSSTPMISHEQRLAQQEAYRLRAEEIQRKRAAERLNDQLNWAESIASAFPPAPPSPPPRSPSPPPPAPSPPLDENTILTLLLSHEHLWSLLSTSTGPLTWTSFPWPLLCPPHLDKLTLPRITAYVKAPCEMGMAHPDSEKERIRDLMKKWHPDRFEVKFLNQVQEDGGERERVRQGAGVVVRVLGELLGRVG